MILFQASDFLSYIVITSILNYVFWCLRCWYYNNMNQDRWQDIKICFQGPVTCRDQSDRTIHVTRSQYSALSFLAEFCRLGIHEKRVLLLNFTYTLSPRLKGSGLHKFKEKQFFQHIHRSNIWEFDTKCCKLSSIVKCGMKNHTTVAGSKCNSSLPRTSLLYTHTSCIFLPNWPATLFSLKFYILCKECPFISAQSYIY